MTNGRPRQLNPCPRCGGETQRAIASDPMGAGLATNRYVLRCEQGHDTELPTDQMMIEMNQPMFPGMPRRGH